MTKLAEEQPYEEVLFVAGRAAEEIAQLADASGSRARSTRRCHAAEYGVYVREPQRGRVGRSGWFRRHDGRWADTDSSLQQASGEEGNGHGDFVLFEPLEQRGQQLDFGASAARSSNGGARHDQVTKQHIRRFLQEYTASVLQDSHVRTSSLASITRLSFGLAALALAGALVARVLVSWSSGTYLSYTEGTWIALAQDAAHGIWYRPISGPDGYGATRYWPLVFGLHAALLRVWRDALATGLLLSALSFAALLVTVFGLARALHADRAHAALAVLLTAASLSVQHGLVAIRGDLLPLALLLAGLAAVARGYGAAAGAVLALAVLGKPTLMYGVAASAAWLMFSRHWRAGARLMAAFASVGAIGVAAMQWLSDGRALDVLLASAPAGGGRSEMWAAPVAILRSLGLVPETAIAIGAALVIVAVSGRWRHVSDGEAGGRLAVLYVSASVVTLAIFATPGVWMNHFADLHVISALVLVHAMSHANRAWRAIATSAVVIAVVCGVGLTAVRAAGRDRSDRMWSYRVAAEWLADRPGDILADQPMVPIVAHRRVFVVDSFLHRAHLAARPGHAQRLIDVIRRRGFAAAVIDVDMTSTPEAAIIANAELGPDIMRALLEEYRVATVIGGRTMLVPR